MRKGGGKSKGSNFEREVCKKLSLWISSGLEEDCFWRSSMSGGRSTVGKKSGKNLVAHAGDISATSEIGHKLTNVFLLECKHYADLNILNIFFELDKGNLIKFWNKLKEDSEIYKRLPMLIAKQNRFTTMLVLNEIGVKKLNPKVSRITCVSHLDMYIIDFEEFLKYSDPKVLF